MKKTYDAVAAMRQARRKLADHWEPKPRKEEIQSLRRKYASLADRNKRVGG